MEAVPFYSREGLAVATYDGRSAGWGQEFGDADFYLEEAARGGGAVLELACGTGRIAWLLAAAGHDVTGLDFSAPMLARAAGKREDHAAEVGARLRLIEGDMCDFDLDRRYRLCLIAFRAFQSILEPSDQARCLAAAHRHLERDGRLIIDLFDPILEWCIPGGDAPMAREETDHPETGNRVRVHVTDRTNDPLHQRFVETWVFRELDADGVTLREERERLSLRWTYRWEMRYLLERAGFVVEAEYSDFRRSPPAYGAEQVWIARRLDPT